eukprot:gnl/Chilomastix_cuspidata/3473.p1 GENE.gnl/Chilomastix_cuspidata/3473~~gnl/Chilomastix_cuspidata/3473.p1  ORF type:complete len:494 (-),score=194.64 gnl/Chilomastix_cuspidata/3473:99-1580(-)
MGITGLLPFLRTVTRRDHVRKYAGKTVALDGYCFMHKAASVISHKLFEDEQIDFYAHYLADICLTIKKFGAIPLIVFDGGHLPLKSGEEKRRRDARKENRARAMSALKRGDKSTAYNYFKRCAEVSRVMVKRTCDYLRRLGFTTIIAPYEADPQLAFLTREGICDLVITEDSDLLVFGAPRVMFKFQKGDGSGQTICLADVARVKDLSGFTHAQFRAMCILSGCDYLDSPRGIGLKTAARLIATHGSAEAVLAFFATDEGARYVTPPHYAELFAAAVCTFRHQVVFDPRARACTHITPFTDDERARAEAAARQLVAADVWTDAAIRANPLAFFGVLHAPHVARAVADSKVDAKSLEPFRAVRAVALKKGHSPVAPAARAAEAPVSSQAIASASPPRARSGAARAPEKAERLARLEKIIKMAETESPSPKRSTSNSASPSAALTPRQKRSQQRMLKMFSPQSSERIPFVTTPKSPLGNTDSSDEAEIFSIPSDD